MKVLMWHVHGAWATAFVHGRHEVLVPLTPDRRPDGRGLPATYAWPASARAVSPGELAQEQFDVVVLQRTEEIDLLRLWCGLRAGVDVPAVFVEHNAPLQPVASRHPLAEQSRIPIVHVTHFNALMWDNGRARTEVIEHGIPDPGARYRGTLPRAAVVVNEPLRRGRVTGTDLLSTVAESAAVDVFGIGTAALTTSAHRHKILGHGDIAHDPLLDLVAGRRVYVHLCRWTSLGLSLLEAMAMGMPVVGLSTTAAPESLAASAAVLTNDPHVLRSALREYLNDDAAAEAAGRRNRSAVLSRFSLERFQTDWDRVLKEVL